MRSQGSMWSLVGLAGGVAMVAWAHVSGGGRLEVFAQPVALLVVCGGTGAALLVSFPGRTLWRTAKAAADAIFRRPLPLDSLVPAFTNLAQKVRRRGIMAVEDDIAGMRDGFLARALALAVTGVPVDVVRQALEIDARVCAERDEEQAQVLDAAAGYAPTLGIIGAVLGLMRVMQQLTSPAEIGAGIAAAFVATVYGVGLANLLCVPLATRLRSRARLDALRRELTIDGVLGLHDGLHPRVMSERLAGYLCEDGDTEAA